jgi:Mg2+-importing ATPase
LISISTDTVDEEELNKPRNWDIKLISRFSIFFGGISSAFDFITMAFLFMAMNGNIALFQTGWFIESTLSEIIVTFAIRTRKRFYQSKPSKILLGMSIFFGFLTMLLPYTPLSGFFGLCPLDFSILLVIFGILTAYFLVVETVKHIFNRKYRGSEENASFGPSRSYSMPTARRVSCPLFAS